MLKEICVENISCYTLYKSFMVLVIGVFLFSISIFTTQDLNLRSKITLLVRISQVSLFIGADSRKSALLGCCVVTVLHPSFVPEKVSLVTKVRI